MTKLTECLCLYLSYALAGDIELLTYLFESACSAVLKTKAKAKHAFLARRERVENLAELLAQKCIRGSLGRRGRCVVLYEVTDVAVLLFAYRRFERDRVLRYLDYLANLIRHEAHALCDFIG